jgi:hypothetical protein
VANYGKNLLAAACRLPAETNCLLEILKPASFSTRLIGFGPERKNQRNSHPALKKILPKDLIFSG